MSWLKTEILELPISGFNPYFLFCFVFWFCCFVSNPSETMVHEEIKRCIWRWKIADSLSYFSYLLYIVVKIWFVMLVATVEVIGMVRVWGYRTLMTFVTRGILVAVGISKLNFKWGSMDRKHDVKH